MSAGWLVGWLVGWLLVGLSVCLSVCPSHTFGFAYKSSTIPPIKMKLGVVIRSA